MAGLKTLYGLSVFSSVDSVALSLIIGVISVCTVFGLNNSTTLAQSRKLSPRMAAGTVVLIIVGLLFLGASIPKEFIYNEF